MLKGLIGDQSAAAGLKLGLDASTRAVRGIAHRVANLSTPGGPTFEDALAGARGADEQAGVVDLEREMVSLADEQLRHETTASLLRKVYQQIRASVREG